MKPCKQTLPISILTLNPAVDISYEISELIEEQKVHALTTRYDPGGNGVNVARALEQLGRDARSDCVIAGEMGRFLQRILTSQIDGISYHEVAGETRLNGTVLARKNKAQYEVSGIGPAIPENQIDEILKRFKLHGKRGIAVLTGSLQAQFDDDFYATLTQQIRREGGLPVVDAHDESLRLAVKARPFLIKPNLFEFETLLGKKLNSLREIANEAQKLQADGIDHVCVSLGRDGAILCDATQTLYARAAPIKVNSTVGAGDSMLAGLISAFSCNLGLHEALRLGMQCGTDTARQPGTGLFSTDHFDELEITIESL